MIIGSFKHYLAYYSGSKIEFKKFYLKIFEPKKYDYE